MANWKVITTKIIRNLINDTGVTPTYTTEDIESMAVVSAALVITEVDFITNYVVDVDVETITPDPASDIDFLALVALKAACMISNGAYRTAANSAMAVRDGPSSIDGRGKADSWKAIAAAACENYDKAKFDYVFGDGTLGKAIVGPYNSEDYNVGGDVSGFFA